MKLSITSISTALIILLSMLVLFSCNEPLPVINKYESLDEIPTITANNVNMTYTKKGYLQGRLLADQFQSFDGSAEPHTDFPKGIKIILYDIEHKVKAEMQADSAIYYNDKRSWVATGNVIVKNVNGSILTTEKLYGDENEKKIFTNKLVTVTQADGSTNTGKKGFESNTEFTIYKFLDGNALIYVREEFAKDAENPPSNNPEEPNQVKAKKTAPKTPTNIKKPEKFQKR